MGVSPGIKTWKATQTTPTALAGGRSYLRHGSVLDLKIKEGKILSLVQGSTSSPYKVEISIQKIKSAVWKTILMECRDQMDSLQSIVDGKLPKSMETLLTHPPKRHVPGTGRNRFQLLLPGQCLHVQTCGRHPIRCGGTPLTMTRLSFSPSGGVKMENLVYPDRQRSGRDTATTGKEKNLRPHHP